LSSTETLEATPNIDTPVAGAEAAHDEHEGHDHSGHDHHHHNHAPTLNPECTREVTIDVPADEVAEHFRKVTKRYQKAARIPGFRAGKVPPTLIRSRFAEQIRQDVVEEILPGHFRAAIDEQGLRPISQPQVTDIQLEDGQPLHFKAIFEILPDFPIEGYQSVTVPKPDTALTDTEFAAELARVLDSRSSMEPVLEDRAIADGDFAEIDFSGEAAQAEGESADTAEQASQQPIEGKGVLVDVGGANTLAAFNDALRGAKPGQELKFEVSYPADFNERRLAGKSVAYQIEVKAIKRKILPELNDEFVKELGDFENVEAFKSTLREQAGAEKKRQLDNAGKDALLKALVERFPLVVPESLVQQQIDARLERGLRALASQGMSPDDMRKLDFDRLRLAQRDSAVDEVKASLLIDRIADAENTEVTDDEVETQLHMIAMQSREPLESVRKRLTEDGSLARIREQLRREKTQSALYEKLV
jgi:trigger factor